MMKSTLVAIATLFLVASPFASAGGIVVKHGRSLKQGAGVGAGCNSILHDADDGSGYTIEDTENTAAKDLGGTGNTGPGGTGKKLLALFLGSHSRTLKQGAGFGAACNSILSSADDASGYTIEDTENVAAKDLGTTGKKLLSEGRSLKQLDKIANGADNLLTAAHLPQQGAAVKTVGDDYDGQGTNDAAAIGAQVGNAEESIPEITQAIPGRKMLASAGSRTLQQLDKISNGADNLLTAAHLGQQGAAVKTVGDDYDSQGTNDAAADGAMAGNAEESIPEITQAIPGRKM